jgi:CRISPR system Cascade subunit CasA
MEPILSWRGRDRCVHRTSLPGVLAALSRADLMDFPRARPHQQHPWSMFLTQLAAIALQRGGRDAPPPDAEDWLRLLEALTGAAHEPWCLFVDDLSKPAFFQPPVPEGTLSEWGKELETPDDLDVLVTAKCHDVKASTISPEDLEAWAYALCSLQTTQGYPGRGYNGIARMNGGYGNRPRVGITPSIHSGHRFLRDTRVLRALGPRLIDRDMASDGIALVWCEPWNGHDSLPMTSLAPHFIEICQRIRLVGLQEHLVARRTTSSSRRCAPEIEGGDVGDAWCPVLRETRSAMTPGSRGYDYRILVEILFGGEYEPAPAQAIHEGDGDGTLLWASALARGQGRTEGLHERLLPLPSRVRSLFRNPTECDVLGRRASQRIERTATMRSKVLFPALKELAFGNEVLSDDFDARVDERFFDSLFGSVDQPDEAAMLCWEEEITRLAERELELCLERAALPDVTYWRRTTAARRMFFGSMKRHFPDVLQRRKARNEASVEGAHRDE